MSQSKVQHIFRVFDALNVVKGIKSVGGPAHQTYYIESDLYAPDRRITPLILQPYVEVSDPNGVIEAGDKVGELSSASWYVGEAILANRITAKESEATLDTPFAIGENNSLHIRENSTKSILLIFQGEYFDIRKDKNIYISMTYTLTTTSNSEVKPAPKLMLSKPQSWKYCPLENQTKAVIEATVSQDSKLYRSAVEWCKVEDNREIPLSDEPFVLGGQNSNKLVVNPHVMGDTLLRARNLSEEVYNKYYGINPEWDGRKSEVVENRNLFSARNLELGYLGLNDGCSVEPSGRDYYNKMFSRIDPDTTKLIVTLLDNVPIGSGTRSRLYFYNRDREFLKWEIYYDSFYSILGGVITVPEGAAFLRYSSMSNKVRIKIEQGDKATPYTPALEDLNYQNLVVNSSGFKNTNSWKLVGNSSNLKIDGDYLGFDIITNAGGWKGVATYNYISVNKGDLCYVKYIVNSQKALTFENSDILDVTLMDKRGASGGGLYVTFPYKVLEPNSDTFISSVILANESSTDAYLRIRHASNDAINFKLKDVALINLTAKFGAGNEPSKDICDEIFAEYGYIPSPYDLAPNGIVKGSYQSDIKFTRYFPKLETEIDFLTGDTLRAGMDTVKMKAVFKTNKEEIKNPEQYFDIKWYLDPVTAGGKAEYLGQGESLEVPITKIPPKARAIPFRLEYEFK